MADQPIESRLNDLLAALKPKDKQPNSASVLDTWIAQAAGRIGDEAAGGRLGWLVASSIAVAAVQRAVDGEGRELFLLKGGTLLQHRLRTTARATKDIDGLVRGDIEQFLGALEAALAEPWGPVRLYRGEVEVVNVPTRLVKPRRFDIYLELRGATWRRVQFEISPDEAGIGQEYEVIKAPPLAAFGVPDPDVLVGIALRHQIAQKLHALTDPHDPPTSINNRPRDVVDLVLLRDLVNDSAAPTLEAIREAALAVFNARAAEARQLGLAPRHWPPTVVGHPHWGVDYQRAAESAGLGLSLNEAVTAVNAWVSAIDSAGRRDHV